MEANTEEIYNHWLKFRKDIEILGNSIRENELPQYEEGMFQLYKKNGNRLIYENIYFERRKYLVTFGLLSFWYKKDCDLKKLSQVMEEICLESTWALPAHVDQSTKNWEKTVDLFACETGQALAQIVDMLQDYLPKELIHKVKKLVISRLLDSYMSIPEGQWRWESFQNNWVAVCGGCLGSIALYLLNDSLEKQSKVLDRVCRLMPEYIAGMCDDGTCPEGLSYYTYGLVYYIGFSRQLVESIYNIPMMETEKFHQIATFQQKCYFPGENTVSFSDSSCHEHYRLGMTCYLSDKYPDVEIPDISSAMSFYDDHCYRFMANYQDDLWVSEYLKRRNKNPESNFYVLQNSQWAIWQSSIVSAAIKGGHNDEPHNHNDIGSFLYFAEGECFLTDLGCGEYTKDYFDPERRYHFIGNRSLGHSVPVVKDTEQGTGKKFAAEYFHADKEGTVSVGFANAYPKGMLESLERKIYKESETVMVLEDKANVLSEGVTIKEHLITQIKPSIIEQGVCLQGKKGALVITVTKGFADFSISEEMFCNHRGVNETVWIIQWEVPLKQNIAHTIVVLQYHSAEPMLLSTQFKN